MKITHEHAFIYGRVYFDLAVSSKLKVNRLRLFRGFFRSGFAGPCRRFFLRFGSGYKFVQEKLS
jgi:hypothetical protein